MLAMAAAVLHFSVSAVPMEQPDVEMAPAVEPPVVEAPADPYAPEAYARPSQHAVDELEKLMLSTQSFAKLSSTRPFLFNDNDSLSILADELKQPIHRGMDAQSQINLALTSRDNYRFMEYAQTAAVKALNTKLNQAWDKFEEEYPILLNGSISDDNTDYVSISHRWEQAVKEATGTKSIKQCPKQFVPLSEYPEPDVDLRENKLQGRAYQSVFEIRDFTVLNVCQLIVNDAYLWLLRLASMKNHSVAGDILSVMVQLRQFSTDQTLVAKLDAILPLFIRVIKTSHVRLSTDNDLGSLMILAYPTTIPFLDLKDRSVTFALILLAASKYREQHPETRMLINGHDFLDNIKMGDLNVFNANIGMHFLRHRSLHQYRARSVNFLFAFSKGESETIRTRINKALDQIHAPKLSEDNNFVVGGDSDLLEFIHPAEMFVNVMDLEQFKTMYEAAFKNNKRSVITAIAGRSRFGSEYMEYVFEDVFGARGQPISANVLVDEQRLNFRQLLFATGLCATVCTAANWNVFMELFVDKLQATLAPRDIEQRELTNVTIVGELINMAASMANNHGTYTLNDPAKRQRMAAISFNEVNGNLRRLAEMLYPQITDAHFPPMPLNDTPLPESAPKPQEEPGSDSQEVPDKST